MLGYRAGFRKGTLVQWAIPTADARGIRSHLSIVQWVFCINHSPGLPF
jgi:hypothetical protein